MAKRKSVRYYLPAVLFMIVFLTACGGGGGTSTSTPPPPPIAVGAPAFSVASGTYSTTLTVRIITMTDGASINYTTDGSTPSATSGTVYSGPITVSTTTMIKAIAYKAGYAPSNVAIATYTIQRPEWTWVSGSSTANAPGIYGTEGVAAPGNVPGTRSDFVTWTDSSGNVWLFGGQAPTNMLNDLWEFNPTTKMWTWVSGSNTGGALGSYGTLGVADASNVPGARWGASSWRDNSGNFWLFGGCGPFGCLNDLWEFNPATKMWTWVSGSNTASATGVYGTMGVADSANVPGARSISASWIDSSGNLWLLGGRVDYGKQCWACDEQYLNSNDLWEFNPTTKMWTWVSGSNTGGAPGNYGTLGVADASNVPGARWGASSWRDNSGNFWLFGGGGGAGLFNDLWEFNTTTRMWRWVSGSSTANATGVYGTRGVANSSNVPGARIGAVDWIDSKGTLWLFGGDLDSLGHSRGNDLWSFDPTTNMWTWMSGSDTPNATGVYGVLGVAAATNTPSARVGASAVADGNGNYWLFGGNSSVDQFNDLWLWH